jgi:hypothetical protein
VKRSLGPRSHDLEEDHKAEDGEAHAREEVVGGDVDLIHKQCNMDPLQSATKKVHKLWILFYYRLCPY